MIKVLQIESLSYTIKVETSAQGEELTVPPASPVRTDFRKQIIKGVSYEQDRCFLS